ncbi:MAG: amidohydrolase family protein [Verrucomicrobia bacterium]|nr:amidohydrolase family protein [Verrucomicrobiota bacterium]
MAGRPALTLRARVVLPVSAPPIDDGAVSISGGRISAVGRWREMARKISGEVLDLGEMLLLPGLINAHCHLDYTGMAGMIPAPRHFTDWIKSITTLKAGWSYTDYAESWLHGTRQLLRHGTTTVADIEAVPELLPEVWAATPLRVFSFIEMTGVKSRRAPRAILHEAVETVERLPSAAGSAGLSPHAPYSTTPELLAVSAAIARRRGWRLVTHVAESEAEFEMFTAGCGAMFDWLARNGRDMADCGLGSPVQQLERLGVLGENFLAIHVNWLGKDDAELLGKRGVHVAHCPRSHAYFGHRKFPREELEQAGVNLCLGTDSLATVKQSRRQRVELNLFAEMQALASADAALPSRTIVKMATLHGARALGLAGQAGELIAGANADLIALPFDGPLKAAWRAVVQHQGLVTASMIGGEWALPPDKPHDRS